MKRMIFVLIIGAMVSFTGCSSTTKTETAETDSFVKAIEVEEIKVKENIIEETQIEENIITEYGAVPLYCANPEYLRELTYNSKKNSWN